MLCIVDYGSGNLTAIANICQRERIAFKIASQPQELAEGTHFLLPGVGAFDPTMEILENSGLLKALEQQVINLTKPILGICVGMHLLGEGSDEGERRGLGWIPGRVRKIDASRIQKPPLLPHMGWNNINPVVEDPILEKIEVSKGFYFLHSYFFDAREKEDIVATVSYGTDMPCMVRRNRIFGAQFHPEKSHFNGVQLLKNFVDCA